MAFGAPMGRPSHGRLRFAAQNRRGLDRCGPFYEHCSVMRERGLMNLGFSDASRWSASENFWVGTFSTETMGTFQPELTLVPRTRFFRGEVSRLADIP